MTLSEAISWCSAASGAAAGISVFTLVEAGNVHIALIQFKAGQL